MQINTYIDLFGNVCEWTRAPKLKKNVIANGYPKPPGSGPAGESCKTCEFKHRINVGYDRKYWKCLKFHSPRTPHQWSGSISSDIRLKSPACLLWEPALSKTPQRQQQSRRAFEIKQTK